ncbi:MAG: hypothetical protein ACRED9_02660 [Caulobacteraceae bacterium]
MKLLVLTALGASAILASAALAQPTDVAQDQPQSKAACQAQWRDMKANNATSGESHKHFMRRCVAGQPATEANIKSGGGGAKFAVIGIAAAGVAGIGAAAGGHGGGGSPASP